jgi:hypothetical protein
VEFDKRQARAFRHETDCRPNLEFTMKISLLILACCFQLSAFAQGFWQPRIGGTNLVANWNFEEGTGTNAKDSIGTNNGTLTNSPAWTNGIKGGALRFLQSSQNNVSVTASGPLQIGVHAFTVSFWVNYSTLSTPNSITLISFGGSNVAGEGALGKFPNGDFYYYANGFRIRVAALVVTNTWYYYTLTGDGGASGARNVTLYENGIYQGAAVFDYNFTATVWFFGQNQSAANETLSGTIDDVRVYNRALTTNEISQLYNSGKGTQQ